MAKKNPTPDDLDEIRELLAEVRRDVRELIAALQDTMSKYRTTEGIRNLPEAPDR